MIPTQLKRLIKGCDEMPVTDLEYFRELHVHRLFVLWKINMYFLILFMAGMMLWLAVRTVMSSGMKINGEPEKMDSFITADQIIWTDNISDNITVMAINRSDKIFEYYFHRENSNFTIDMSS